MNRKILFILFGALAAAGFFFWWAERHGQVATENRNADSNGLSQTAGIAAPRATTDAPSRLAPSRGPERGSPDTNSPVAESARKFIEEMRADPSYQFEVPIRFYGKVLDQDDRPLAEADVGFRWNRVNATNTEIESGIAGTKTDGSGLFSLEGQNGNQLAVSVGKPGYYNAPQNPSSFEYADPGEGAFYTPDPQNPVVFHLRRKGKPERLLARSVTLHIPRSGDIVGFDPIRCKLSPDGPLLFRFSGPSDEADNLRLQIQIKTGGVQGAEGDFPFEAPEQGYYELLEFDNSAGQKLPELQCFFYFGEPRIYGRLRFSPSVLGGSGLALICLVNQSGSRNLEFEPGKFIERVPDYYLDPNKPLIDDLRSQQ